MMKGVDKALRVKPAELVTVTRRRAEELYSLATVSCSERAAAPSGVAAAKVVPSRASAT